MICYESEQIREEPSRFFGKGLDRLSTLQVIGSLLQLLSSALVAPEQPETIPTCGWAWLCSNKTLRKQATGQVRPEGCSMPTPGLLDKF